MINPRFPHPVLARPNLDRVTESKQLKYDTSSGVIFISEITEYGNATMQRERERKSLEPEERFEKRVGMIIK